MSKKQGAKKILDENVAKINTRIKFNYIFRSYLYTFICKIYVNLV